LRDAFAAANALAKNVSTATTFIKGHCHFITELHRARILGETAYLQDAVIAAGCLKRKGQRRPGACGQYEKCPFPDFTFLKEFGVGPGELLDRLLVSLSAMGSRAA
jgi:hypothetical protein